MRDFLASAGVVQRIEHGILAELEAEVAGSNPASPHHFY